MSSSAVYSGEFKKGVDLLEAAEFKYRETRGRPVARYDLNLTTAHHECSVMTLNCRHHSLQKLCIEIGVSYFNICYQVCRHGCMPPLECNPFVFGGVIVSIA